MTKLMACENEIQTSVSIQNVGYVGRGKVGIYGMAYSERLKMLYMFSILPTAKKEYHSLVINDQPFDKLKTYEEREKFHILAADLERALKACDELTLSYRVNVNIINPTTANPEGGFLVKRD
ncbi:hypothetical protein ACPF04_06665 [Campylobacter sp. MOP51]|uniref:hypothetical protein n=1 Tax=Campylobacter canis TaxID=3378588 RepID=UPI003C31F716